MYICNYCAQPYVKNATKLQRHIVKCLMSHQGSMQAATGKSFSVNIRSEDDSSVHPLDSSRIEGLMNVSVAPPVKKKPRTHLTVVRDEEPLLVQNQREFEERWRRDAREEHKEERASLMTMWKEMMEFQGNLLKEFIHRSSSSTSLPSLPSYSRPAHHNQGPSTFPSTSYMAPYTSPGAETENESMISHEDDEEEEEEKYIITAPIAPVPDSQPVNHVNDSQSKATETLTPAATQTSGQSDLQTTVLRRQERVLQLQEEYYSLKIQHLKHKISRDAQQHQQHS